MATATVGANPDLGRAYILGRGLRPHSGKTQLAIEDPDADFAKSFLLYGFRKVKIEAFPLERL